MMDLPFVGVQTFFKAPYRPLSTWDQAFHPAKKADLRPQVAVLGVPWDEGVGFTPGQRWAPQQIRIYSARYQIPPEGLFQMDERHTALGGLTMVDAGDVSVLKTNVEGTFQRVTDAARQIIQHNAFLLTFGGDHSVSFPLIRAFESELPRISSHPKKPNAKYSPQNPKLGIIHFDAHLDFNEGHSGIRYANDNPFRRAAELAFVGPMIHLGIRGLRTSKAAYEAAQARGNQIVTTPEIKRKGVEEIGKNLAQWRTRPEWKQVVGVYLSLDMDVMDPSIAPGTSAREPGGLTYEEAAFLLRCVTQAYPVVAMDVVEVNPHLDPHGGTATLASALSLETLISKSWNISPEKDSSSSGPSTPTAPGARIKQ